MRIDKDYQQIFDAAVAILMRRAHGVVELRAKLQRKFVAEEFADELFARVVARLLELDYLDDEKFVRGFLKVRTGQGKSRALVRRELQRLEIDSELIAVVLDGDETVAEEELATAVAEKKWQQISRSEGDPRKQQAKLFRFLAARGFAADLCWRVWEGIER